MSENLHVDKFSVSLEPPGTTPSIGPMLEAIGGKIEIAGTVRVTYFNTTLYDELVERQRREKGDLERLARVLLGWESRARSDEPGSSPDA